MLSHNAAFKRLGLSPDADARAVRQAYARELKLIDQDTDAAGFQHLREAYELALAEAQPLTFEPEPVPVAPQEVTPPDVQATIQDASRAQPETEQDVAQAMTEAAAEVDEKDKREEQEEEQAPAAPRPPRQKSVVTPPVPPEEQAASSWMLARAVFDDFTIALAMPGHSDESVRQLLDRAMHGPRLVALDAREHFEHLVAGHLAQAWQPGNEILFGVAVAWFNWAKDRRRLQRFGVVGHRLSAAVDEWMAFEVQEFWQRKAQLDALRILRTRAEPDRTLLDKHLPRLRTLLQHFPTLVPMLASNENLENWVRLDSIKPSLIGRWAGWIAASIFVVPVLIVVIFARDNTDPPLTTQQRIEQTLSVLNDLKQNKATNGFDDQKIRDWAQQVLTPEMIVLEASSTPNACANIAVLVRAFGIGTETPDVQITEGLKARIAACAASQSSPHPIDSVPP